MREKKKNFLDHEKVIYMLMTPYLPFCVFISTSSFPGNVFKIRMCNDSRPDKDIFLSI